MGNGLPVAGLAIARGCPGAACGREDGSHAYTPHVAPGAVVPELRAGAAWPAPASRAVDQRLATASARWARARARPGATGLAAPDDHRERRRRPHRERHNRPDQHRAPAAAAPALAARWRARGER